MLAIKLMQYAIISLVKACYIIKTCLITITPIVTVALGSPQPIETAYVNTKK